MVAYDIDNFKVLLGWDQLVTIDFSTATNQIIDDLPTAIVLRTTDYDIGIQQTGEAPDYITGRQDRTAWKKGPIESEGTLTFPFTLPSTPGVTSSGIALFRAAADLAASPQGSFSIHSSAHPSVSGCKVQSATLSCESGREVTATATVWGIADPDSLPEILELNSYEDIYRRSYGGAAGNDSETGEAEIGPDEGGTPDGEVVTGDLQLEQIPQWDVCSVSGAPEGMYIIGWSLTVENNLVRNYTMGDGSVDNPLSPLGLNATSISSNQRRITGTVTWQSNQSGFISQILATGLHSLTIQVASVSFTMTNCLWNATPPRLSANDRVTVESSFTALGSGDSVDGFDALVIDLDATWPI